MNKYIQEIIDRPEEYEIVKIVGDVRIKRYKYLHVLQNQHGKTENVLIPYSDGTWASYISYDSYGYTHGGKVYRAAVDMCHALQDAERNRK